MKPNVLRAMETFCLTCAIFASILISMKYSYTKDIAERRHMVFIVVAFLVVSVVYLGIRIQLEARRASRNRQDDGTRS